MKDFKYLLEQANYFRWSKVVDLKPEQVYKFLSHCDKNGFVFDIYNYLIQMPDYFYIIFNNIDKFDIKERDLKFESKILNYLSPFAQNLEKLTKEKLKENHIYKIFAKHLENEEDKNIFLDIISDHLFNVTQKLNKQDLDILMSEDYINDMIPANEFISKYIKYFAPECLQFVKNYLDIEDISKINFDYTPLPLNFYSGSVQSDKLMLGIKNLDIEFPFYNNFQNMIPILEKQKNRTVKIDNATLNKIFDNNKNFSTIETFNKFIFAIDILLITAYENLNRRFPDDTKSPSYIKAEKESKKFSQYIKNIENVLKTDLITLKKVVINSDFNLQDLILKRAESLSFIVPAMLDDYAKEKIIDLLYSLNKEKAKYFALTSHKTKYLFSNYPEFMLDDTVNERLIASCAEIIKEAKETSVLKKIELGLSSCIDKNQEKLNNYCIQIFDYKEKKEISEILRNLALAFKDISSLINMEDEASILQSCQSINEYIESNNIKNKTTKQFKERIEYYYALEMKTIRLEKIDLFDLLNKINTLKDLKNTAKSKILKIDYSKEIDAIRQESKDYINNFLEKIKFDFDKYYNTWENYFLNNSQDILECKNQTLLDMFNRIIKVSGIENEIKNVLASSEYYFKQLNTITSNAELTPLIVCQLKAVEQFMFACVKFSALNGFGDKFIEDDRQHRFHILKDDWSHVTCFALKNYLIDKVVKNSSNKLLKETGEQIDKMIMEWISKIRNALMHKENIYNIKNVETHKKTSNNIIRVLTCLFVELENKKD